ncbi:hypothetical protein Tco_0902337 [Tanacetum coccineum]
MADNRTMAQMLQAPIEGYEDAIVVPPINANNFELKQPLINLVQSNKFTVASLEDKMTVKMKPMMNEMKALVVTTPATVKAVEEALRPNQVFRKRILKNYVKANDAVLKKFQNQGQNLQNQMANVPSLLTSLCDNFKNSASTSNPGTLPDNFDSEGDIAFLDNLLSDDDSHNLASEVISDHEPEQNESSITFSPRMLYEISTSQGNVQQNSVIESLPISPIPVEDSEPTQEKIDILLIPDDLISPGVEDACYR